MAWRSRSRAYPSSALFDVATEGLGNSSVLKRLVDVSRLPSSTKEHTGAAHVFGEGTSWETTDAIECGTADGVA